MKSLVCYPQFTFDRRGTDLRGDGEEISSFGFEDFERVMRKAVRRAYRDYRAGARNVLHFERIRSGTIHDGYRLPPRVFTRHSIWEIAKNIDEQSFIVRFATEKDKLFALDSMSAMTAERQYKKWGHYEGSRRPAISTFFDVGDTLRGLLKITLNMVAAYCPNTPVNHATFNQAMRLILGEAQPHPALFNKMGFTKASDIQFIRDPNGGHSFRMVYLANHWLLLSSYFGGRIGSLVFIPGPNNEDWACADIVAPLRSRKWTFTKQTIVQPMHIKTQWLNISEIAPSLKWQNTVADVQVEVGPRKYKKRK